MNKALASLVCASLGLLAAGCDTDLFTVELWNSSDEAIYIEACQGARNCDRFEKCKTDAGSRCPIGLKDGSNTYVRIFNSPSSTKPSGCLVLKGDQNRYDRAQWDASQASSCDDDEPVPPDDIDAGSGGD